MAATNQQPDIVHLEYDPKTRKFYTVVDGDFAGIALAIAHAMSINKSFALAVQLANHIRGMPPPVPSSSSSLSSSSTSP